MVARVALVVLLTLLARCLTAPVPQSYFIPPGTKIYVIGPGGVVSTSQHRSLGLVLSTPGGGSISLPALHPVFTPTNPSKVSYVSASQPGVASTILALAPPDTQTLLTGAIHPEKPELPQVATVNHSGTSDMVVLYQYGLPSVKA